MPPSAPPPYGQPLSAARPAVDQKVKNLSIGMIVCAALVLIATFTNGWASGDERGVKIGAGLTGPEVCFGDHCKSGSWDDTKAPTDFTVIGYLGMIGGLAAAGVGIALGVFGLTGKPNPIPEKVANGIFGVTAFAFTFFTIRLLTEDKLKGLSISYSAFLGIGGIVGVGVLANMIKKARAGA